MFVDLRSIIALADSGYLFIHTVLMIGAVVVFLKIFFPVTRIPKPSEFTEGVHKDDKKKG